MPLKCGSTISLCLIVRDAEKTIDKCLSSFAPIADQVVIVDTGSVDKTIEIATKYTSVVYHFVWTDDFSAARNYAFDKCTKDIILWVDADDWTDEENIKKIRNVDFRNLDVLVCQYKYSDTVEQPRERFVRRTCKYRWKKRIHEELDIDLKKEPRGFISDIWIYHDQQGDHSERNFRILESIIKIDPDPIYKYDLAREYVDKSRWVDAVPLLIEYEASPGIVVEHRWHCHYMLGQCARHRKDDRQSERDFLGHMLIAIGLIDERVEPYYAIAENHHFQGHLQQAIMWYKFCTHIKPDRANLFFSNPAMYSYLPHFRLAQIYKAYDEQR